MNRGAGHSAWAAQYEFTPHFQSNIMVYTVTLHHAHAPCPLRQAAEIQYRQVLEHALGGVDGVLASWHAWQTAEHLLGNLPEETWKVARRWIVAAEQARIAALRGWDDAGDAYFEVQPANTEDVAVYVRHA